MGWLELNRWIALMDQRKNGKPSDPGSWSGTDDDPWWKDARAKRAAMRGR